MAILKEVNMALKHKYSPTLIASGLSVEGSLTLAVVAIAEYAKLVMYSAWWSVCIGAPDTTMYPSPIVCT